MNGITAWMEKHLVPVAAKIGGQKHLVALRDSFVGILPATLAGALAAMISAVVTQFPQALQQMKIGGVAFSKLAPEDVWSLAKVPVIGDINNISGLVNQGTLVVIGLIFAFSWGFNLAKAYGVNELAGGVVSVATLFAGLPNQLTKVSSALATVGGVGKDGVSKAMGGVNGVLGDQGLATWKPLFAAAHLDAGAYFTVIIMGALAVIVYAKLMLADITIKMPDSVPPAVAKAFLAIIPTIASLYLVSFIYYIVNKLTGDDVINLISHYIAEPFQILSQSLISVIIITVFVSVLWFFGLHGPNVLAPALDGIWGPLGLNNQALYFKVHADGIRDLIANGAVDKAHAINGDFVNLWVRGSFDAFAWFGGTGGTFTFVLAILMFSKRKDYKMVGKLGLAPGFFNINEPVLFGLPVVLNPMFIIPFIFAPVVATIIAYLATMAHMVSPVVMQVPWVTPPVLNAFMATGFDWRAAVLAIINLGVTFLIWTPFVISSNKLADPDSLEEL